MANPITKKFSELYNDRWLSPKHGLHAGIDLHDWQRFIMLAIEAIDTDPDPSRRYRKYYRLLKRAQASAEKHWTVSRIYAILMVKRRAVFDEHTVKLIGVGDVWGKEAQKLKPGEQVMFNYGYTATVIRIDGKSGSSMLTFTLKDDRTGKESIKRCKLATKLGTTSRKGIGI